MQAPVPQIALRMPAHFDVNFTTVTAAQLRARHDWVVTANYNGTNWIMILYMDGAQVETHTVSSNATDGFLVTLCAGYNATDQTLIGQAEYIYIWINRVLSSTDVSTLAAAPYSLFL
jgi:hypothetical protein